MTARPLFYDFVRSKGHTLVSLIRDMGPGFLVTVGFIDPGNIATNVVAGAQFGYTLLWVVLLGTVCTIILQEMSARLGIASGLCLSEAIRKLVGPSAGSLMGILAGVTSVATVAAELLGAAVGLSILFSVPILAGTMITSIVAGIAVWFNEYHHVEDMIMGIVGLIGLVYLSELFIARPEWGRVLHYTFVPHLDRTNIFVAVGVLGAIVMPTNFFLHSAIVQTRNWSGSKLSHEFFDTTVSMAIGGILNIAVIVVAAGEFHRYGILVNTLDQAAATLTPVAGPIARYLFAIALIFAGFSSTITGAMAGSYAVGGFFAKGRACHHESRPFRFFFLIVLALSTLVTALPFNPLTVILVSQAALGIMLIFAAVPLVLLMSRRDFVGKYVNMPLWSILGWASVVSMIMINSYLLITSIWP